MSSVSRRRPPLQAGTLALALAITMLSSGVRSSSAQSRDDLDSTALSVAPEDAAFFATSINLRQAWEDFIHGTFVARVRAVAYVQKLEAEFNNQWAEPQGQLAQVKETLDNPNVQNLVELALDMSSNEVFIYGSDEWCELIDGLMDFQNDMASKMSEGPEVLGAYFNNLGKADVDRIRIPTTVIGFRLSDDENAKLQLDALEGILRLGIGQTESLAPLMQKIKRSDLSDGQTLSVTLDTSLIPLEMLNDEQRMAADKAIELLEGRSISLAIGVRFKTLLIAFGEGDSVIDSIGENSRSLLDHEKLAVLKEAKPENLRSVSFVSQRWRESSWNANFEKYFQRLAAQFSMALESEADEIPDLQQWRDEIDADAKWLDSQVSQLAPEFGPSLSWSTATKQGAEGYTYDWSENVALANATPMAVLEHSGTSPLLVLGFKQRDLPGVERLLETVLERVPKHLKRFITLAEDDEEDRAKALMVLEKAWPLVEDAYAIVRDKIGPALGDNESLLTVAAQWTTTELGPGAPLPSQPLPLPELAGACRLKNQDLFLSGCVELYDLFDDVVNLVQEIEPGSIPAGYSVPRPEKEDLPGGTRYYYREFSDAIPVDGFEPQVIVADDVIIYGYSDRQIRDMLQAKPLATRPAWLTDETPTAGVTYVDLAGMVAAAHPWLEFGLTLTGQELSEPLMPGPGPVPTGDDVLQIWDCFASAGKTAATIAINQENATVTRWVWVSE